MINKAPNDEQCDWREASYCFQICFSVDAMHMLPMNRDHWWKWKSIQSLFSPTMMIIPMNVSFMSIRRKPYWWSPLWNIHEARATIQAVQITHERFPIFHSIGFTSSQSHAHNREEASGFTWSERFIHKAISVFTVPPWTRLSTNNLFSVSFFREEFARSCVSIL